MSTLVPGPRFRQVGASNQPQVTIRSREYLSQMTEFRASTPDEVSVSAFIDDALLDQLQNWAVAAKPNEVLGVLLGRRFRDRQGIYAVITSAAEACTSNSGVAHVQVSAESLSETRRAALADEPMLDPVGWWHSHPSPSGFSSVDRREQATWTHTAAIGLVVFMRDTSTGFPAAAYCGPAATPMDLVTPGTDDGSHPAARRHLAVQAGGPLPDRPPERSSPEHRSVEEPEAQPPRWSMVAAAALLAAAVLGGAVVLSGAIRAFAAAAERRPGASVIADTPLSDRDPLTTESTADPVTTSSTTVVTIDPTPLTAPANPSGTPEHPPGDETVPATGDLPAPPLDPSD